MKTENPFDYYNKLIHYLSKVFFDKELCEEAAHIACYKAIKKADTFNKNKAGYYSWLYRIAYNSACDLLRKQTVEQKYLESVKIKLYTDEDETLKIAEAKTRTEVIAKLIKELEPLEANVISLKYINDYKNSEIAKILSCDKNHVSNIIYKAKKKLKERIKSTPC